MIHTENCMKGAPTLIAAVYAAFNQRNIDGALALMSESVSWPKASEGGQGLEPVLSPQKAVTNQIKLQPRGAGRILMASK
jgi:hypothetical protein